MAAPIWKSYAVNPLGFSGIATFLTWVVPGSDVSIDAILEVAAFADTVQVTDPLHLSSTAVKVPLDLIPNSETYAEGLPSPVCVVSWFTRLASGWVAGPVRTGIPTGTDWDGDFPYSKLWVVSILQEFERETLPLGAGKTLAIRSAYPRDSFPIPCISVNFDASPAGPQILGDIAAAIGPQRLQEKKGWNITISILFWSDSPEERDALIPWLGKCAQALIHLAPYKYLTEPNFSITEQEDFSGMKAEVPLFIGMVQLTGIVWSTLEVPVRNPVGHFTI